MQLKPQKTVRFSQLVESAGHPVPATLWTAPEDDAAFSKAMREERVLTVIQRNVGAKADYGLVGFFKQPLATYLLFPRKLPYPLETKVVGIKYEELAEAKPSGSLHKPKPEGLPRVQIRDTKRVHADVPASEPARKPTVEPAKATAPPASRPTQPASPPKPTPLPSPPPPPPPPPPKLHRFRAEVEIVARQVVPVEVEARSTAEAATLLKRKAAELKLSTDDASVTRHVRKARKLED